MLLAMTLGTCTLCSVAWLGLAWWLSRPRVTYTAFIECDHWNGKRGTRRVTIRARSDVTARLNARRMARRRFGAGATVILVQRALGQR